MDLLDLLPISGYRVFFPDDLPPEDFPDAKSAWERRNQYMEQTGQMPHVRTLRNGDFGNVLG